MKKTLLFLIPLSFIIVTCVNVSADTIIDLGTISYQDYLQVNIPGNFEVQLIFITSIMNESDIGVQNLGFVTGLNYTRYLFTSNTITPTFEMKNTTLSYFYQDLVTLQLYIINVDYSEISIPIDPDLMVLDDLQTSYDSLFENYTIVRRDFENLTNDFDDLNISYMDICSDFNNTKNNLSQRENELGIRSSSLLNITIDRNKWRKNYNNTIGDLINQSTNLTHLEEFYKEIKQVAGVYVPLNTPIPEAREKVRDKIWDDQEKAKGFDTLSGVFPISLIVVFIIPILVIGVFLKTRRSNLQKYTQDEHKEKLNRIITGHIFKGIRNKFFKGNSPVEQQSKEVEKTTQTIKTDLDPNNGKGIINDKIDMQRHHQILNEIEEKLGSKVN